MLQGWLVWNKVLRQWGYCWVPQGALELGGQNVTQGEIWHWVYMERCKTAQLKAKELCTNNQWWLCRMRHTSVCGESFPLDLKLTFKAGVISLLVTGTNTHALILGSAGARTHTHNRTQNYTITLSNVVHQWSFQLYSSFIQPSC